MQITIIIYIKMIFYIIDFDFKIIIIQIIMMTKRYYKNKWDNNHDNYKYDHHVENINKNFFIFSTWWRSNIMEMKYFKKWKKNKKLFNKIKKTKV